MSNSKKPKKTSKRNTSKKLKPLKQGDTIEIIAPGSGAPIENLEKGAAFLRSWGYNVIYDKDILNPQMYLAQSDQYRFESFKKAMLNKNSNIIWCLRGGYGANRLLPMIQKMAIPKSKKLLIGYSDICSLHTVINQKWKWPTLHASLIDRLGEGTLSTENLNELKRSITENHFSTTFTNLVALNKVGTKQKKIKSKVVGGNLIVMTSTLGTPSQVNLKNKILFLEEISERAYRVDRCLHQMKQSGVLDHVSAVVFGQFVNCQEKNGEDLILETLKKFFRDSKIPAFIGINTGHGAEQRPLFLNTPAVLTCGKQAQMVVYSDYEVLKPRK